MPTNLFAAGIEEIMQIDHGNARSLYFKNPEGNGVECYMDTFFQVAQSSAGTFDADEIEKATRERIKGEPEFRLVKAWQLTVARRLERR